MTDTKELDNGQAEAHADENNKALLPYTKNEKADLELSDQQNHEDHDLDTSKVKFINGGTGASDVHVDVEGKNHLSKDKNEFVGLSKEELMKFATDPFWIRTRWILLVLFWVGWFAMLAAAVLIIVFAPKCPPRPPLTWWQKSSAYEVFPESFMDTNDDGVGDLKGVQNKLEYLEEMKIGAVSMNSIVDGKDFKTIKPEFGTQDDFDNMIIAMHKRGIRLIMDFVPNHTSRNHTWFMESRKSADNDFSKYYVWHPGKDTGSARRDPPNDWKSVHGGSAWEFDSTRGQYYLHQFLPDQPDLNLREPAVLTELDGVLTHWLGKSVDGFRVNDFERLFEGVVTDSGTTDDDLKYQPEMYNVSQRWSKLLEDYSKEEGRKHPRLLVVEVENANTEQIKKLYESGVDMPMNTQLLDLASGCDAKCIQNKLKGWMTEVPAPQTEKDRWSNWQIGNSDTSRVFTRMAGTMTQATTLLHLTLPGSTFVYYGEEIAMHDVDVTFDQSQDPVAIHYGSTDFATHTRDPERTPMQWSGQDNAGFSKTNGTIYLPVADDYKDRNVQAQSAHGSGITELEVFKNLMAIKHEPSLCWGIMEYVIVNDNILSYVRQAEGFPGYLVAINFGTEATTENFQEASPKFVPMKGTVATSTSNFVSTTRMADFEAGTEMTLEAVYLKPGEGVVVSFEFME